MLVGARERRRRESAGGDEVGRLVIAAVLLVVGWVAAGGTVAAFVPFGYLAIVTGELWIVDRRERRLPNSLVLPGYGFGAIGVAWCWLAEGISPAASVVTALAYAGALFLPAVLGGMGMGDVKLAGVLGLALGSLDPVAAVFGAMLPFVGGGVAGLAALTPRDRLPARTLAFGPFMLGGFWAAAVLAAASAASAAASS